VVEKPNVLFPRIGYFRFSKVAASEIFKFNPNAKIKILLRDYASYLQSYHHQSLYTGFEDEPSFTRARELSARRQSGQSIPKHCTDPSMLDYKELANFFPQVKRYFDVFPKDQILLRWLDDWKSDPREFYVEILEFLGLEDDGRKEFPKVHAAHAHRFRKIGELTAHPPGFVLKAARIVKSILGIKRLGIAGRIRKSNTVVNDKKEVPAELLEAIKQQYKEDRQNIEKLILN